jgi:hypothetical protein
MSPTALRLCAIPLGLLAFALRLMVTFRVEPLTWDLNVGTILIMGGVLIAVGIPLGIFALLGAARCRRPASFALGRAGFIVPASPIYGGLCAITLMSLSGGFVMSERAPNGDSMRLAQIDFAMPASAIMVGLCWIGALTFIFVQRPQVYLDAGGLTIRRVRHGTRIAWDELAPGGPPPPRKRSPRQLKVFRNAPPVWGRFPPSADIPVGWLHVDPAFLATAIRRYVEHHEARAAIGTAEELARLPVESASRSG